MRALAAAMLLLVIPAGCLGDVDECHLFAEPETNASIEPQVVASNVTDEFPRLREALDAAAEGDEYRRQISCDEQARLEAAMRAAGLRDSGSAFVVEWKGTIVSVGSYHLVS